MSTCLPTESCTSLGFSFPPPWNISAASRAVQKPAMKQGYLSEQTFRHFARPEPLHIDTLRASCFARIIRSHLLTLYLACLHVRARHRPASTYKCTHGPNVWQATAANLNRQSLHLKKNSISSYNLLAFTVLIQGLVYPAVGKKE